MSVKNRIAALVELGYFLNDLDTLEINDMCQLAFNENRWFEPKSVKLALSGIRDSFLNEAELQRWVQQYTVIDQSKKVGLVLAGNIPAVGWHDIQCVFVSGNISLIKYSDKDKVVIPFLIGKLLEIAPELTSQFVEVERLKDFDAVIATGSDNSARYFESYFSKYPHIIRKNRNAIAILNGNESTEDFSNLGLDIFSFFGLGCRNVSKIYVPQGYNFTPLLEVLHSYNDVVNNNKYKNNFDYTIALFLLNKVAYQNNGSIIIREDERLTSRIATLHYEYYESEAHLHTLIESKKTQIQCIMGLEPINGYTVFSFGKAQKPFLSDYADGVDTMHLLTTI